MCSASDLNFENFQNFQFEWLHKKQAAIEAVQNVWSKNFF